MPDPIGLTPVGDETDGDFLIPDWDEGLVTNNSEGNSEGNPHEDDE